MAWISAAASIVGGALSSEGAKKAAKRGTKGQKNATLEQRRQFNTALGLSLPGIEAGNTARDQLLRLLGLPTSSDATLGGQNFGNFTSLTPQEKSQLERLNKLRGKKNKRRKKEQADLERALGLQPGQDTSFLFDRFPTQGEATEGTTEAADPIDIIRNTPGFQFQIDQRTRALNADRSNRQTSGGPLIKDFSNYVFGATSSDFYKDYANRLAALAGSGQTAAQGAGNQAILTGRGIGQNLENIGLLRGSGVLGQANAFADLAGNLGQIDWGSLFGGNKGIGTGGPKS